MKSFTVRLPEPLIKRVKLLAVAEDTTCQDLVRQLIEAKLEAKLEAKASSLVEVHYYGCSIGSTGVCNCGHG